MKRIPYVLPTPGTGALHGCLLLAALLLSHAVTAATCFGPFLDYDYARAACGNQLAQNANAECLNEQPHLTCGGVFHAVKLYRDCLGGGGAGCSFPYYSGSCPAGEWPDPETGVCKPVEDNPAAAKNFGPCHHAPSDFVGNPVKTSTGNNFLRETDHPGFGRGILRFERTYNSGLALLDPPVPAWRHTYERRIRETRTRSGRFRAADRPDGSSIYFRRDSLTSGVWKTDSDVHENLEHTTVAGGITEYRLILTDGTVERYDGNGVLQSITDRAGNRQNLVYNDSGRLERVESSTGEYLLLGHDSQGRLTTLADHTGRVWVYRYDAEGNLEYVHYPDGSPDGHADNPYRRYHYEDSGFRSALTGISDRLRGVEVRYATWAYDELGRATLSYHGPETGLAEDRIEGVMIRYDGPANRTVTSSRGDARTYRVINRLGRYRLAGIAREGCTACGERAFSYDPETGHLITSSLNGIVTEYGDYTARDEPGYLIEAVGLPEERRTDYTYDPRYQGKIATLTEPSVNPSGKRVTSLGYDDFGNRISETVSGFAPDGRGGWVAVARTTRYRFDGPLHQLSQIDGPRRDVPDITRFRYYADDPAEGHNRARLREIEDASGELLRSNIHYTPTGKLASEDRPNGIRLTYTYYPGTDRLATLERSAGTSRRVTRWTYLETGEIESITRAYGSADATTITLGYDPARRLNRIMDGLGNHIDYQLDTEGNLEEETIHDRNGVLGRAMQQTFDNYSHLDVVTRASEVMDYDFAPDGTLERKTSGKGIVTTYDYDNLNRLVMRTQDAGVLNAQTGYGYHASGRLQRVTDPENGNTRYLYDDFGDLHRLESPDTGVTVYARDEAGNLKSRIDGKGQQFNYRYDVLNRLTVLDAPGTQDDIIYEYDDCKNGLGRLCRVTTGTSVVSYSYDAFGNITSHQQVGYAYDDANRLEHITYPSGAIATYQHDAAGRISRILLETDGQTMTLASNIAHAPFGGVTGLTYGNGKTLSRGYDNADRMIHQRVPSVLDIEYRLYDAAGNLTQLDDAIARASSHFVYDPLDRLDTASGPFGDRDYDHDLNGNRSRLLTDAATTAYVYESGSNRILSETGWSHALDANGNTVSRMKQDGSGEGRSFSYTAHNRLASVTDHVLVTTGKGRRRTTTLQDLPVSAYTYNGLGQRILKQVGDAVTRFVYGRDGALLAELDADGAVLREYVYLDRELLTVLEQAAGKGHPAGEENVLDDGDPGTVAAGNWVLKESNRAHAGDYRLAEGGGSAYRWTPQLEAGSYDVYVWYVKHRTYSEAPYRIVHDGQVTTASVDQGSGGGGWFPIASDLSFDGAGNEYVEVGDTNGRTVADAVRFVNVTGGTDSRSVMNVYYVHNDQRGTPLTMTDTSARVVWQAVHDPFGKASVSVAGIDLNIRLPGQYFDHETGLHYNYYRMYDPASGRFITSDPIGLEGGLNTYVYAGGNPVRWIDPLGLRVKPHPNGVNRSGTFAHGFSDYFDDLYGNMNPYPEGSCRYRQRQWAIDLMRLGTVTGISDIAGSLASGDAAAHRDLDRLADILTDKAAGNIEYLAGRYAANAINALLLGRIFGLRALPAGLGAGAMGTLSLGGMGYASFMRGVKILEPYAARLFPCGCGK